MVKDGRGRPQLIKVVKTEARHRSRREMVKLTRWNKSDPTDLDELMSWASRMILVGGLAVGIILTGFAVLAFPTLIGTLAGVFL
jgi:hypothetical protein